MELVEELGILSPKTEVIAGSDDLRQWAARTDFPMVLKADGTSGGRGVRIVHSLEEAESALRTLSAPPMLVRSVKRALLDGDFTLLGPSLSRRRSVVNAQAFVQGREATSAIACWRGKVLASLHFEVIEKAQPLGHATVVRVVENREMSLAAERIVRRLCLSGLLGLDFMLAGKPEKAYLIELNPRATQVGHLTLGSGRDLPAALYAAVSGDAVKPAPKVTDHETISLFPQEWIRDAGSRFLSVGYHDVPWQEPDLVHSCVQDRRKQRAWYGERAKWPVVKNGSAAACHKVWNPHGTHSYSHAPGVTGRVLSAVGTELPPTQQP